MTISKTILLFLTALIFSLNVSGQQNYGTIKLKVKQDKSQFIWTDFILTNKDTTIHCYINPYKRISVYDSIPEGKYNLTLFSELNDKLEKQVTVQKKTHLKLNAKGYYSWDSDTTTFLSKLQQDDTIKIFVDEYGCFHWISAYCRITRKDSVYFIHFNTVQGQIQHQLTDTELGNIMQIETIGRTRKKYLPGSTTSAWYLLSVDRKLIKFRISGSNYISKLYSEINKSK